MVWILVYNPTQQEVQVDSAGREVAPVEFTYADKGTQLITSLLSRGRLIEVPITFDPNGSPVGIDPEAFEAAGEVILRNGGTWTPPTDPPVMPYTLAQLDALVRTGRLSQTGLKATTVQRVEPFALTLNSDGSVATELIGGLTTTYTYNTDGTLHTATRDGVTITYSYDANGNMTGAS